MYLREPPELTKNSSVAVIICGMLREWEYCVESFHKNFIMPNKTNLDIDIFLITYDITDRYKTNRKIKEKISNDEFKNLKKQFNTENLHILNFEKNKQQILNYMDSFENTPMNTSMNHTQQDFLETIYMQSYLLKQSLNFVNNKKYDCIMRTRFDILYDKRFIVSTSLMPGCIYQLPFNGNQNFVDNCFLGDFESMKEILSSYDFLSENPNSTMISASHGEEGPALECVFLNNMKKNNIRSVINENWKVSLLRDAAVSPISKHPNWKFNCLELYYNPKEGEQVQIDKHKFMIPTQAKGIKIK